MKTSYVLLATIVFATFICSGCTGKKATPREKSSTNSSEKLTYSEIEISMVIDQCRERQQPSKQREEWPKGKHYGPSFFIKTDGPITSTAEFREILKERPKLLKTHHVVEDIIDHKEWFIAVFKNEPPTQSKTIMRAYTVKKGSKTICYWFNW